MFGAGLKRRGRESIYGVDDVERIVRMSQPEMKRILHDGDENPIGKAYSRKEFTQMLSKHFQIESVSSYSYTALASQVSGRALWLHDLCQM